MLPRLERSNMNLLFSLRVDKGLPMSYEEILTTIRFVASATGTPLPHGWDFLVADNQGRLFLNKQVGPATLSSDGGTIFVGTPPF